MKHLTKPLSAAARAIVLTSVGLASVGLTSAPQSVAAADSVASPVVVELFTSQGCSSCPPADALLGELAKRADVIALSFHVDYWNRLGWTDPFSNPANTQRQRDYRSALGLRYVYTPQMVVGGTYDVVGSDRGGVERAIGESRAATPRVRLTLERLDGGRARLTLPETAGTRGRLVLFGYDTRHRTEVRAGENAGRELTNANVVSVTERLGGWSGEAVDRVVDLPEPRPDRGYAVLLMEPGEQPVGRVLGTAGLRPSGAG